MLLDFGVLSACELRVCNLRSLGTKAFKGVYEHSIRFGLSASGMGVGFGVDFRQRLGIKGSGL